jgi:hypothetical protein
LESAGISCSSCGLSYSGLLKYTHARPLSAASCSAQRRAQRRQLLRAYKASAPHGRRLVRVLVIPRRTSPTAADSHCPAREDSSPHCGAEFPESLRLNTTLTKIDLGGNDLGNDGVRSLTETLHLNTTLTSINLLGNGLGDEGGQSLSKALRRNTTLRVITQTVCPNLG